MNPIELSLIIESNNTSVFVDRYTFDPEHKLIILNENVTSFSVADIYSRWKDWIIKDDNAKYLPAFYSIGGDIVDPTIGTTIPLYAFLINGWRIRPQERDHTLVVYGGVIIVEGGGDPFTKVLGNYQVSIRYSQPVQAIGVSTSSNSGSGVSATAIREEIDNNSTKLHTILEIINTIKNGLTSEQETMLVTMYKLLGLDPLIPLVVTKTSRTAGPDIVQSIQSNESSTTVTRI